MRSHADVENAVCRLNHSGLERMPFTDWHANSARAAMCMIGLALVGWFQNACLTAALAKAAPERLRWELWHLPALVCRAAGRVLLRLPEPHPGAKALLAIAHPQPTWSAQRPPPARQPRHAPTPTRRRLSTKTAATGPARRPRQHPEQPHTTKPRTQHTQNTTNRILVNNQG